MEATIIKLAPSNGSTGGVTTVTSATFEEAFGEFSEFRGRGRARRQARRQERRMRRINNRRQRKQARQAIRNDQQEARQSRKDTRKTRRLSRKEMGNDGSEEESQDQGQEEQSNDQQGSDEQYQEEQPQQEEQSFDEGYADAQQEEGGYEESDDSGFDGVMSGEDRFSEMNDESKVRVQPAVQDVAKKIEWNKELISRLKQRVVAKESKIPTEANQVVKEKLIREVSEIKALVNSRIDRVKELEGQLEKYANFEGEFSGADGEFSEFRGRRGGGGGGRRREVRKAKRAARQERRAIRKQERQERKNPSQEDGGSETPVENELNPQMSEQRIEVPAEENNSNATGTGLNGLDLVEDYDAPAVRTIELSSNADGNQSVKAGKKINWTAVAIGVGVAAVAIWAIKKYKILEASK